MRNRQTKVQIEQKNGTGWRALFLDTADDHNGDNINKCDADELEIHEMSFIKIMMEHSRNCNSILPKGTN
jgi:hypothetical protein